MDPRTLGKRALLALLAYLGLLCLWPLLRPLYAPAFRAAAEFSVGVIDPLPGRIRVRFEPGGTSDATTNVAHTDTTVHLQHAELAGGDATFGASSFFHAYHPTAFLLALFLAATPLAWRTRRMRLLWALLALHAFLALRCAGAAYCAYGKGTIDGRPALALSPAGARVLRWAWHFLWEEALTTYLVPLVIWSLLVFVVGSTERARAPGSRD